MAATSLEFMSRTAGPPPPVPGTAAHRSRRSLERFLNQGWQQTRGSTRNCPTIASTPQSICPSRRRLVLRLAWAKGA